MTSSKTKPPTNWQTDIRWKMLLKDKNTSSIWNWIDKQAELIVRSTFIYKLTNSNYFNCFWNLRTVKNLFLVVLLRESITYSPNFISLAFGVWAGRCWITESLFYIERWIDYMLNFCVIFIYNLKQFLFYLNNLKLSI